jgi:hypothetical protein
VGDGHADPAALTIAYQAPPPALAPYVGPFS